VKLNATPKLARPTARVEVSSQSDESEGDELEGEDSGTLSESDEDMYNQRSPPPSSGYHRGRVRVRVRVTKVLCRVRQSAGGVFGLQPLTLTLNPNSTSFPPLTLTNLLRAERAAS
jgi:hypothetical protein